MKLISTSLSLDDSQHPLALSVFSSNLASDWVKRKKKQQLQKPVNLPEEEIEVSMNKGGRIFSLEIR